MKRSAIGAALLAAGILVGGALLPARGERPAREQRADLSQVFDPVSLTSVATTITRLEERVAGGSAPATVYSDLGLAYLQQGRVTADPIYLSKADAAFDSALAETSDDFRALLGSAILAGSQHRFFDMEELARRAVAADPFSGVAYGVLGDALLETQRYGRAANVYQKMLNRRPDLSAFARVSYLHETLGDFEEARRWMRRVLDSASSASDIAYASYHLFHLNLRAGDMDAARRNLDRAVELAPDSHLTLAARAHLAYIEGDIDDARVLFGRALELYPSIGYFASLAELSVISGDEAGAAGYYAKAAEREELYLLNGALVDPELAVFTTDTGRVDEAVAIASQLHRDRRTGATEEALGWALHNQGHHARALRLLEASIRHRGDSHTMFFAAQAALALGRDDLARQRLADALELDPYFSYRYAGQAAEQLEMLDGS